MEPADDGIRIGTGPGRLEIGQAFFDSRALLSNDFFQLPIDALTDLTVHGLAADGTRSAAQFIRPGQGPVDTAQGGLFFPQRADIPIPADPAAADGHGLGFPVGLYFAFYVMRSIADTACIVAELHS